MNVYFTFSFLKALLKQNVRVHIPADNYKAYTENEKKVRCDIFYGNASLGHSCFVQINVHFQPFVDTRVPTTQLFHKNALHSLECPIRAPNFPPYEYEIFWYVLKKGVASVLYSSNFTFTSYFLHGLELVDRAVYTCFLVNKTKNIVASANITASLSDTSKANLPSFYDLSFLWALTALVPLAGLLGVLKKRRNLQRHFRTVSTCVKHPEPSNALDIIEFPLIPLKTPSLAVLQPDSDPVFDRVDIVPLMASSPPPSWNQIKVAEYVDVEPERRSCIYQTPIMCMSSMASMVATDETVAHIGSPCALQRLHERIVQFSGHVQDVNERERLYLTAERVAGRAQPRFPSYL